MNKIIITLVLVLSGCATTTPNVINNPKVQPSFEIMKDCEPYSYPKGKSFKDFQDVYFENAKIYKLCSEQNNYKKQFIIENSK